MDISKLQKGDLLFFMNDGSLIGNFISLFEGFKDCIHVAIYDCNGYLIESHIKTGVVRRKITEKDTFEAKRVQKAYINLYTIDFNVLLIYLGTLIGRPYDVLPFPGAFLHTIVAKFFKWKRYRKTDDFLNNPRGYFCSELITEAFHNLFIFSFTTCLHYRNVTPSILYRSHKLMKIDL